MLVITPTGISTGENKLLLKASHKGKNMHPAIAEAGMRTVWSPPTILRII